MPEAATGRPRVGRRGDLIRFGVPVGAFDYGSQGRGEDGACTDRSGFSYESDFGGLGVTVPPFDASEPAEVTVGSSLTVSYAVVPSSAG